MVCKMKPDHRKKRNKAGILQAGDPRRRKITITSHPEPFHRFLLNGRECIDRSQYSFCRLAECPDTPNVLVFDRVALGMINSALPPAVQRPAPEVDGRSSLSEERTLVVPGDEKRPLQVLPEAGRFSHSKTTLTGCAPGDIPPPGRRVASHLPYGVKAKLGDFAHSDVIKRYYCHNAGPFRVAASYVQRAQHPPFRTIRRDQQKGAPGDLGRKSARQLQERADTRTIVHGSLPGSGGGIVMGHRS